MSSEVDQELWGKARAKFARGSNHFYFRMHNMIFPGVIILPLLFLIPSLKLYVLVKDQKKINLTCGVLWEAVNLLGFYTLWSLWFDTSYLYSVTIFTILTPYLFCNKGANSLKAVAVFLKITYLFLGKGEALRSPRWTNCVCASSGITSRLEHGFPTSHWWIFNIKWVFVVGFGMMDRVTLHLLLSCFFSST